MINHKIIAHQMTQDPLTVSHPQREKRMFYGKLNAQRENCIFFEVVPPPSGFEHYFHLDHWMQEFPKARVTVFKMHLFTCVFQHMFQGLLIFRSHLQRGIPRSHDCKKMFQVFQTLTFARYNSTKTFASAPFACEHSDVTVRFFESDTRPIECERLRGHSTWVFGNSTRLHADFTPLVILGVTVRLVSKFLFKCPGKSDFRIDR